MRSKLRAHLESTKHPAIRIVAMVACILLLVVLLLHLRLGAKNAHTLLETDESRYYLPSTDWLVPASVGYREAAAGVVWVALLTYFGGQHEILGNFEHFERYLEAVTELDPYFYRAYTWGSAAAIYNGNLIDRQAIELSIETLHRGLRYFPNDGDMHYFLGFQYYFELTAVSSDDERERFRQIGIDEICTGAILGGGPPYLPLVCSSLAERVGLHHLAGERLAQTLLEIDDPNTRARIVARMESTMPPDASYRILRRLAEFRRRWQNELHYAPIGFYAVTGPRPVVPWEDEIEFPLHLDSIIAAETEELFRRMESAPPVEPESENWDDDQSSPPSPEPDDSTN